MEEELRSRILELEKENAKLKKEVENWKSRHELSIEITRQSNLDLKETVNKMFADAKARASSWPHK